MGVFDNTRKSLVLTGEEALYLLDRGCLEIFYEGVPLSMQEVRLWEGMEVRIWEVNAGVKIVGGFCFLPLHIYSYEWIVFLAVYNSPRPHPRLSHLHVLRYLVRACCYTGTFSYVDGQKCHGIYGNNITIFVYVIIRDSV